MNLKTFAATCTLLVGISGCVSKPNRPDSALCGSTGAWQDSRGQFQEDARLLLCTNPLGYSNLEDYIDKLELRIRELERRRCRK